MNTRTLEQQEESQAVQLGCGPARGWWQRCLPEVPRDLCGGHTAN